MSVNLDLTNDLEHGLVALYKQSLSLVCKGNLVLGV